ncbi:hypothetical protein HYS48_01685 [Candidatus Woesearchaeota archaeon]|nr:hypothetical protein [Candidatus Woesearchaeota archaeon]
MYTSIDIRLQDTSQHSFLVSKRPENGHTHTICARLFSDVTSQDFSLVTQEEDIEIEESELGAMESYLRQNSFRGLAELLPPDAQVLSGKTAMQAYAQSLFGYNPQPSIPQDIVAHGEATVRAMIDGFMEMMRESVK